MLHIYVCITTTGCLTINNKKCKQYIELNAVLSKLKCLLIEHLSQQFNTIFIGVCHNNGTLEANYQIVFRKISNIKINKLTKKLYFRCCFIAIVLSDIVIYTTHLPVCFWYHNSLTYYCKQSLKY